MAAVLYVGSLLLIVVAFLLRRLIQFLWDAYQMRKSLVRNFSAPPYHWLYGHMKTFPGFNEEALLWQNDAVAKHPRYYVLLIGPTSFLQLNHPETIKAVTNTAEPKQLSFGGGYRALLPWIGEGLLLSSGSKWFRNRKLLTHGFHFDILKPYVAVYNDSTEQLIKYFEKASVGNESVDIVKPVSYCTLEIIMRCAMSFNKDAQNRGDNHRYVDVVNAILKEMTVRFMEPLYQVDFIYYSTKQGKQFSKNCEISHRLAEAIIHARKETLSDSDTIDMLATQRYVDFLDILLLARDDDGHGLTLREIRDEVETFMFAGYDTTTSGISWILYNLAAHPTYQARAREEVDALLDGRKSDELLWEDMSKLPYLTRCIKESLRLHSTVPLVGRELAKSLTIDGKLIPAGAFVHTNIWNLHHNPTVWENPSVYDPDRFLPEKINKMDSHAFMPFSAGPRNCIGQNFAMNEMKITVARILRLFDLSVDTSKPIKMFPDAVLRAENGLHLFFHERNKN